MIQMSEKKLNKVIVNTVDEELKRIFGETATLVIYGYLENNLIKARKNSGKNRFVFSRP